MNPVASPFFRLLQPEQRELIHRASLEILRRTGVRVYHAGALALLRQTGSVMIDDDNRVRFQPGLVEWAIRQAPTRIALCRRGSDEVLAPLEGRSVSFGTGSDCVTYLDPRTWQRRRFTAADVVDCVRIVDALPQLQFCMSMGIPVEEEYAPYRGQFATMVRHTSKPIVFVCDDRADCEAIVAMAAAVSGGSDALRQHPSVLLYSEPSSPLRHSKSATDKLLYMAQQGLPIVHAPGMVQGGTGPITLAGALAQANAEILSSLVMHQLQRAGAPFVYGSGMHHLDMRTTISVYTCPEFLLARAALAEMGQHYGLPTWGFAGDANSCLVDEQAAAEATVSIMGALLAGNNLTHDVGYLESGKTTSPEMIVLCDELISMLRRFMGGIALDAESLALDVIHAVGPDGDFLSTDHTYRHFRQLWQPALFSRLGGEEWAQAGGRRLNAALRDKTVALLDAHQPPPLPAAVEAELAYLLQQG